MVPTAEKLALIYKEQGPRPAEIADKLGVSVYTATQIILAARPVTTTCIDCASQRCASVTAAFAAAYPDIGGAGSLAKPHDPSVRRSALNIAPDHGAAGRLADRRLASAA
ncbi:MAG TPA: hypothetical protein VIV12_05745 [Streptosporangiaceae bacterium]